MFSTEVKFYKLTQQGLESTDWHEADILSGSQFREILETHAHIPMRRRSIGNGNVLVELEDRAAAKTAAQLLSDFLRGRIAQ